MTTMKHIAGCFALAVLFSTVPASASVMGAAIDKSDAAHADALVAAAGRAVDHGQFKAAREDMERAETALLNKAAYDGTLEIAPGTGVVVAGKLAALVKARQALATHDIGAARIDLADAR